MPVAGALVSGLVGGALSMEGAADESAATQQTNQTNAQIAAQNNLYNYMRWMESRGRTSTGQNINAQLPTWAGYRQSSGFRVPLTKATGTNAGSGAGAGNSPGVSPYTRPDYGRYFNGNIQNP